MSDRWIERNLNRMKKSKRYSDKNKELAQNLLKAMRRNKPKLNKLIIEAIEDNGIIVGGKLQPLPKQKAN
ncbi:hypothetical protein HR060_13575 [Catenovulum sp. SM1970]|uniref:hypothetical protein n=1 Tax=Marinifaba aquimaris TaxID=2741323 RepID=UPI0015725E15|nr:hypothetical protein [Marinifaba aquimaris]NTS77884.1 hypothetical protein [Marinifaba aquimaris]